MNRKELLEIWVDGSCRANGKENAVGGIGLHFQTKLGEKSYASLVDVGTNNQAEYLAVVKAVEMSIDSRCKNIKIYSDSKLVVQQVNKKWAVKDAGLKKIRDSILEKLDYFESFTLVWIPREDNKANDVAQAVTEEKMKNDR